MHQGTKQGYASLNSETTLSNINGRNIKRGLNELETHLQATFPALLPAKILFQSYQCLLQMDHHCPPRHIHLYQNPLSIIENMDSNRKFLQATSSIMLLINLKVMMFSDSRVSVQS